jgi:hypothetical protein
MSPDPLGAKLRRRDHPAMPAPAAATGLRLSLKFPRLRPEFSCSINHLRWIPGFGF